MAYDHELADRIRRVVSGRGEVTEKEMFGGIAFMWLGKMFVGVIKDELMIRVGRDQHEAVLGEPHVRVMAFTGRPMRGFLLVGPDAVWDLEAVRRWVDRTLVFVKSELAGLAPKAASAKASATSPRTPSAKARAATPKPASAKAAAPKTPATKAAAPKAPSTKAAPAGGSPEVDAYIAQWPPTTARALTRLRAVLRKALPEATEVIAYGLPTFKLAKNVIAFGGAAKHCAIYPMSGSIIATLEADLADYGTSKGTIRFDPEHPLPDALIKKIIRARLAEIAALGH
jgi:uncharacterized protein YdhG (YjbR/CyaY superfamily)